MIAAWGALLRLARRDIRRNPGRSLLVVVLIALPVAGVVAATTWYTTARITPVEQATKTLGTADLAIYSTDTVATTSEPPHVLPDRAQTAPLWRGENVLCAHLAEAGIEPTRHGNAATATDAAHACHAAHS